MNTSKISLISLLSLSLGSSLMFLPLHSFSATSTQVKDNCWLFPAMPYKGRNKGKNFNTSWPLVQPLWLPWVQMEQACHFWISRRSLIQPKLSLSAIFMYANYSFYFASTSLSPQNTIYPIATHWNFAHLSMSKWDITTPTPLTLFRPSKAESKGTPQHVASPLAHHI